MTLRLVTIGAVVTAVTVVAAVFAVSNQPTVGHVDLVDEPAFTALRARPQDVARITVADPDGAFTLARDERGRWVVRDRDGYPAAAGPIRTLVATLADMRLVESKTARPDRFARLEVEDLDAEEARSRSIRLEDGAGEVLAEAIIGKRVFSFTGGREAGTYVRRAGDDRAWLVSGGLDVATDVTAWLEREIVDVPVDRIRRLRIAPRGGDAYTLQRESADADFTMTPVPEGRDVAQDAVRRAASAFAGLELEDVAPAEAVSLPPDTAEVEVETLDGLRLTARLGIIDDAHWAVFTMRPAGPTAASGETSADAAPDRPLEPWAFRLAATVAERLAPPPETLLEPPANDAEQR